MENTNSQYDGRGEQHQVSVSQEVYLRAHEIDANAWREADATGASVKHHFQKAIDTAWLEEDDRLRELELADEREEREIDARMRQAGTNWSPMGYHNPCRMDTPRGIVEAPLAIAGLQPDLMGGGVLFWAYSDREANEAFDAYRAAGYHNVRIDRVEGCWD